MQAGQAANNQQPVNSQLTARQPGISQQAGKAQARQRTVNHYHYM